jgi:hypothetical protein
MERWMREQIGIRTLVQAQCRQLALLGRAVAGYPRAVIRIVDHLDRQAAVHADSPAADLKGIRTELRRNNRRTLATLAAVGLAACATALLILPPSVAALPLLAPSAGVLLMLFSLALLWRALLAQLRLNL